MLESVAKAIVEAVGKHANRQLEFFTHDYFSIYAKDPKGKMHVIVITGGHGRYHIESLLVYTKAKRHRWLINGQPSTGTKLVHWFKDQQFVYVPTHEQDEEWWQKSYGPNIAYAREHDLCKYSDTLDPRPGFVGRTGFFSQLTPADTR